jgi:hypothetical protein
VHQPARRLVAAAPEDQRRLAAGAARGLGLVGRRQPDEPRGVVGVVLDVRDENPAVVQLGREPRPERHDRLVRVAHRQDRVGRRRGNHPLRLPEPLAQEAAALRRRLRV